MQLSATWTSGHLYNVRKATVWFPLHQTIAARPRVSELNSSALFPSILEADLARTAWIQR